MTNTIYFNHFGIPNQSFIEVATRVVPEDAVGHWTRESVPAPTTKPFPRDDAWRKGDRGDLVAAALFATTLFSSAIATVLLV